MQTNTQTHTRSLYSPCAPFHYASRVPDSCRRSFYPGVQSLLGAFVRLPPRLVVYSLNQDDQDIVHYDARAAGLLQPRHFICHREESRAAVYTVAGQPLAVVGDGQRVVVAAVSGCGWS